MNVSHALWGSVENPGFFRSKTTYAALITAVALAALGALIITGVIVTSPSLIIGASLLSLAGFTVLLAIALFSLKSRKKEESPNLNQLVPPYTDKDHKTFSSDHPRTYTIPENEEPTRNTGVPPNDGHRTGNDSVEIFTDRDNVKASATLNYDD